jgi:hypothetical protein
MNEAAFQRAILAALLIGHYPPHALTEEQLDTALAKADSLMSAATAKVSGDSNAGSPS